MLPEVPTTKEGRPAELPGLVVELRAGPASWRGTPRDVVIGLHREMVGSRRAIPEVDESCAELDVEPRTPDAEQTAAWLHSEIKRWGDAIVKANVPRAGQRRSIVSAAGAAHEAALAHGRPYQSGVGCALPGRP
jgi:hypothetical protein